MLKKGIRRSQIYVPANNLKMLNKANELEPDSMIFDLEDSVPVDMKEVARNNIRGILSEIDWGGREICVRINPIDCAEGYRDLVFVSEIERIDCLVIPKSETGISRLYKAFDRPLIPLIESASSLLRVEDLVRENGVCAISWASGDLALSINGSLSAYEKNEYVMMKILEVARTYGVEPIDKVFFNVADIKGFVQESKYAKGLGFSGKQLIHPSQIGPSNEVFSPSTDEMALARRIIQAYEESLKSGRGAIRVDGKLVDKVHVEIAKRILGIS